MFTERLQELRDKATPRPWTTSPSHWGRWQLYYRRPDKTSINVGELTSYLQPGLDEYSKANADLITFLVNHSAGILDVVEAAGDVSAPSDEPGYQAWLKMRTALSALNKGL